MKGLKFRVLLDSEQSQEVFRDILVSTEDTFEVFYETIKKSFNFAGQEMASFYVSNEYWDKGHEISWMDMRYDESDKADELPTVMATAKMKDFISDGDQKFILVYDFLRMWIFLIELIGYQDDAPNSPVVLMAIGEAPLEDSKPISNEIFGGDDDSDDDDDFGFDDMEDGFDEEDFSNFDDFEI